MAADGSMQAQVIAFWEAIGENGPVPYEELSSRVEEVLTQHPEWINLADPPDTTVLYSGGIGGGAYTGDVAQNLAARGQDTIGIIDNTVLGQALGGMMQEHNTGNLETIYGRFVDFSETNISYEDFLDKLDSTDPRDIQAVREFSGNVYEAFDPASRMFASNASGAIITVTPDANPGGAFYREELPRVLEGLDEGRITSVNGVERAEILQQLDGLTGTERLDRAFESMNEAFADNVRRLDLDVHAGERVIDGETRNVAVLDVEPSELSELGAGDNTRIDPPDTDGLRPLDVNGFRAGNARLIEADAAGELRGFAADPSGNTSYLIDTQNSTIYTVEQGQLQGVQRFENSQDAGQAFGRLLSEAGETYPSAFNGLPSVHNSLGGLGNHIDELASPAWRRMLGNLGDGAADLAGKGSKILGPLGVAAAGYEVYTLEMKLQDYEEFGLVPPDAMLAYRAILTGHTAQATLDPTLLGGELAVQAAHDERVEAYNISPEVAEALEPGSLLEDLNDARQWLEDQAAAAGEAIEDYAVSRFNDPSLIVDDLERIGDAAWDAGVIVVNGTRDVLEDVGEYGEARWEDPSLLLDDAEAIGDSIGSSLQSGWNWLMGNDEPSALEQSLQGGDTVAVAPETVPYPEAVERMSADYKTLQDMDPQSELPATQLADHPAAEDMLKRLSDDGITRFPKAAVEGDTPQERLTTGLTQAREIDRDLSANRTQEVETETSRDTMPDYAEQYDYSSGI